MTFLEMAKLTLEKANIPLTVDEIWNKGLEYGYAQQVMTTGKTPTRTIGAQLYVNIKDNTKSDFCIISKRPTRFALSVWDKIELESEPIETADKQPSYVYLERDLHQILAYFAYNYLTVLTRTINDKISKGGPKDKNEWLHPEMVGLDVSSIKDFSKGVISFSKQVNQTPISVFSFELNSDYKTFIEASTDILKTEALYREKFDKILSPEEVLKHIQSFKN